MLFGGGGWNLRDQLNAAWRLGLGVFVENMPKQVMAREEIWAVEVDAG